MSDISPDLAKIKHPMYIMSLSEAVNYKYKDKFLITFTDKHIDYLLKDPLLPRHKGRLKVNNQIKTILSYFKELFKTEIVYTNEVYFATTDLKCLVCNSTFTIGFNDFCKKNIKCSTCNTVNPEIKLCKINLTEGDYLRNFECKYGKLSINKDVKSNFLKKEKPKW